MTCRSACRASAPLTVRDFRAAARFSATCIVVALCAASPLSAQQPRGDSPPRPAPQRNEPTNKPTSSRQAGLEEAFEKMLSGATLEGSFTSTGRGSDPTKLRSEKYTIGEVKKLGPGVWQISAHPIWRARCDASDCGAHPLGRRYAGDRRGQPGAARLRNCVGPRDVLRRPLRRLLEARRSRRPPVRHH